MIAVVSSTVAPSAKPSHDGARTTFSPEERLRHTRETIDSLIAAGIHDIIIADNSPHGWLQPHVAQLVPARVIHFEQPPIRNKGLGEMWLLLGSLDYLPPDVPVLKISGRYRIGKDSPLLAPPTADISAKVYRHPRQPEISTRCYVMRDRQVAERLWTRTIDEIYAAPARIVGPRSLLRIIKNSLRPQSDTFPYSDPPGAVEVAAYNAIRNAGLSLSAVDHLSVEGILGSWTNPSISE